MEILIDDRTPESVTYRYSRLGERVIPRGSWKPNERPRLVTTRVAKSTECIVCPVLEETYSCPLPKAKPYGSLKKPVPTKVATVPEFVPVLPPVMLRMQLFPASAT